MNPKHKALEKMKKNESKKKSGQSYKREHEQMYKEGHTSLSYSQSRSYEKNLEKKGVKHKS